MYPLIRAAALLIGAALLEVAGDAMVRRGLERRSWLMLTGAISLIAYGVLVNQGHLEFGRLMGCYIAVFFLVSQLVAIMIFHQIPAPRTLIGGALIVVGGHTILI
jgi:drug/metabolite transporter superfamily protein YnfA